MLCRGIRTFCSVRVPLLALNMSAPVPTSSASAPKRALSTSPPPPPSLPTAVTSSSNDPAAKKVKLTVEEPVSVPPNLVEAPVEPAAAVDEATAAVSETSSRTVVDASKPPAASSSSSAAAAAVATGKAAPRKPRQRKGKAPKPGGVEEAGAFDVIELLGAERVKELQRLQEEEGRDWTKEAELEWGKGPEGKDVEVRVAGSNDHGAFFLFVSAPHGIFSFRRGRRISSALLILVLRAGQLIQHVYLPRRRRSRHPDPERFGPTDSTGQHPLCASRRTRPHPPAPTRTRLLHVARGLARDPRAERTEKGRSAGTAGAGPRRKDGEETRRGAS